LVEGEISTISPTEAEIADDDSVDLQRVALHFDRRSFGRLRKLIDELNSYVELPTREIHIPPPFRDELPERPW
jgi:hypothetical protein